MFLKTACGREVEKNRMTSGCDVDIREAPTQVSITFNSWILIA